MVTISLTAEDGSDRGACGRRKAEDQVAGVRRHPWPDGIRQLRGLGTTKGTPRGMKARISGSV